MNGGPVNVLVILPNKTTGSSYIDAVNKKVFIVDLTNASDMDGIIVLHSSVFEEIFGITKKISSNYIKQLPIIKISENGKHIYRAYKAIPINGFTKDYAGLTSNSLCLLNDVNGNNPTTIELSPGRYFPFYWHHPDKSIRISFKLGLLSALLGLLSIIISIVSFLV